MNRLLPDMCWPGIALALLACSSPRDDRAAPDQDPAPTSQPPASQSPASQPSASQPPSTEIPWLEAQGLDATEERILARVDALAPQAEELLQEIVDINSGTMNHPGVRQVGEILAERLARLGFETRWIDQSEVQRAGHLFAERAGTRGKRVLLIGHLDTVFEKDSPFQRFERLPDGSARGPGVVDMKGGDVAMILALEALFQVGALDDRRIVVALTGDEEDTGDPLEISRRELIAAARESDVALGFEGGLDAPNTITIARRGFTGWSLRVHGERGHSSVIFSEALGAGAAFESARILDDFYRELRGTPYLTFNAGLMLAGTSVDHQVAESRGQAFGKTNVVPQIAVITGDLRALTTESRDAAKERMRAIVARNLPGTSATIEFADSYPPMAPTEGNRALAAELDRAGRDMGLERALIVDPGVRGAADISFAAPHVDSLAGLGAVGHGAHSTEEVMDLGTLPAVSKRAAVFIYRLTRDRAE